LALAVPACRAALSYRQLKMALDTVAFLPLGRLIDLWRRRVFSGGIAPASYNGAWWELRRRYQGITPPVARSEANCGRGAKARCAAAGLTGPLREGSTCGAAAVGARYAGVLAATRRIDAAALTEYLRPLMGRLSAQSKERQCGTR
jgi:peptidyl-dipeptidase A